MPESAVRVSDFHTCPVLDPMPNGNGTFTPVPHIGGRIQPPGSPDVLIGGKPAATVGALCQCTGSLQRQMDIITQGSSTVRINAKPAARRGDRTAHGGVIAEGAATVMIG